MSNLDSEYYSKVFKALGHVARINIVTGLTKEKCNVNQIAEKLNLPQSTISQHLGVLRNAGIIEAQKTGVSTCYTIKDKFVNQIISLINS